MSPPAPIRPSGYPQAGEVCSEPQIQPTPDLSFPPGLTDGQRCLNRACGVRVWGSAAVLGPAVEVLRSSLLQNSSSPLVGTLRARGAAGVDSCTERARATPPAQQESVYSLLTPLFLGKGSQLWAVLGWPVPCAHGGERGMGDAGRR